MATQKFTGVIPPVVVPDTEDHQLDVASFERSINRMIDAGVDHAVDAALKGGNVELVVFGIGNNDGRDNAGEFLSCHKNLLSCLVGSPMPPTLVGSVQAV